MTLRSLIGAATLAAGLASSAALAWDQFPFDYYSQRSDTVTLGAGNARDINAATQIINPWPPYAFDRRIPGNGQRMVGAVKRYENPQQLRQAPCPMVPVFDPAAEGGLGRTQTASGQCGAGGIGFGGVVGGAIPAGPAAR
jgi:hypothetical protein